MKAIENFKTMLFFSFKIDQHSKIASLFFTSESDKNFFSEHFLKCPLVMISQTDSLGGVENQIKLTQL
jgi:hypothetical protein